MIRPGSAGISGRLRTAGGTGSRPSALLRWDIQRELFRYQFPRSLDTPVHNNLVKGFASKTLPTLEHHLDAARRLEADVEHYPASGGFQSPSAYVTLPMATRMAVWGPRERSTPLLRRRRHSTRVGRILQCPTEALIGLTGPCLPP